MICFDMNCPSLHGLLLLICVHLQSPSTCACTKGSKGLMYPSRSFVRFATLARWPPLVQRLTAPVEQINTEREKRYKTSMAEGIKRNEVIRGSMQEKTHYSTTTNDFLLRNTFPSVIRAVPRSGQLIGPYQKREVRLVVEHILPR